MSRHCDDLVSLFVVLTRHVVHARENGVWYLYGAAAILTYSGYATAARRVWTIRSPGKLLQTLGLCPLSTTLSYSDAVTLFCIWTYKAA